MAKKKNEMTEVSIKNLRVGDFIYLEEDSDEQYEVLDVGNPFILVLNCNSGFAYVYKPKNNLYKK